MFVFDAAEYFPSLQDAIKCEAAMFIDGGESVQDYLAIARGRRGSEMRRMRELKRGGSWVLGDRGTSQHLIHGARTADTTRTGRMACTEYVVLDSR